MYNDTYIFILFFKLYSPFTIHHSLSFLHLPLSLPDITYSGSVEASDAHFTFTAILFGLTSSDLGTVTVRMPFS